MCKAKKGASDPAMTRPTISACMIVKNEEKMLPNCLRSIRNFVDEIIVVDTGSSDNTVGIAESFGAQVFHHPWENHFSKHRNQSLDYAGSDWLFIIDADEELVRGSGEELRKAVLTDGEVDAISVVVECPFDNGEAKAKANSIRVIRNQSGLRYEGRVHNYLVGVKNVLCTPIRLLHHGYNLDPEAGKRKFKRTTELLKKDIREDPKNPRPHHFLGAAYLSENMFKEAAQEAERAIGLYEKRAMEIHNLLWSLYIASSAYLEMGEIEKAGELAQKGIGVSPHHLDSYYMLAMVAYRGEDRAEFDRAMVHYLTTKSLFEKDPAFFAGMVHNTVSSEWILHLLSGCLYMDEGDPDQAREEFQKSEALCSDRFLYHSRLAECFWSSRRLELAEEHYVTALRLRPQDGQTMWALAHIYENLGRVSDQVTWLERLVNHFPEFPRGRFALGLAHMRLENFESALALFRQVGSSEPENQEARVNEAICLRGLRRYAEAIRLLKGIDPGTDSVQLAVTSNMALCYHASGQSEHAIGSFQKMAGLDPHTLEPPVYLSRLFLEKEDLEGCVTQCERLLALLGVDGEIVLNSPADLGKQFFQAGNLLASSKNHRHLARICFDSGILLGYDSPEVMSEIGATLVLTGDVAAGTQFLEGAFSRDPENEKVKEMVMNAAKILKKDVSTRFHHPKV